MNEAHPFGETIAILDQPIGVLHLTVRALHALSGVYSWPMQPPSPPEASTVGELVAKSAQELLRVPNFGKRSLQDVREQLAARGLYLRGEEPPSTPPPVFSPLTLSHRLQVIEAKLDLILSKLVPP